MKASAHQVLQQPLWEYQTAFGRASQARARHASYPPLRPTAPPAPTPAHIPPRRAPPRYLPDRRRGAIQRRHPRQPYHPRRVRREERVAEQPCHRLGVTCVDCGICGGAGNGGVAAVGGRSGGLAAGVHGHHGRTEEALNLGRRQTRRSRRRALGRGERVASKVQEGGGRHRPSTFRTTWIGRRTVSYAPCAAHTAC